MAHGRVRLVLRYAALGAVLLPLLVIWLPEVNYHYVRAARISDDDFQATLGGVNAERCSRFARHDLSVLADIAPDELVAAVASLRTGAVRLPRLSTISFDPAFSSADLSSGSSAQLHTASLVVADLMLTAWRKTGDLRYLESADRYIRGWWNHEASSWFPIGFQWNDHAVASRVFVLSRYLCAIKAVNFDTESARVALLAIVRSGERLTKPNYFTYRTNHGVMQNIALMHIAAMYPRMPQSRRFAALGATRFAEQLDVFLSPEGVVNEHSAGYHAFGLRLMGMALEYFSAFGLSPPPSLAARHEKAQVVLEYLRRPDGTLPAWGNTVRTAPSLPPAGATETGNQSPPKRAWWGPISGLSIWWESESAGAGRYPSSQTVVTWSSFATRAHRHLDEMAVFIWTPQSDILIGSGYWPVDAGAGEEARGWAGANAPRFVGEPPSPPGGTRLVRFASSTWLEGVELERSTARGERLRRQVFFLRPNRWIIIDAAISPSGREFETSWLLDPNVSSTAVDRTSLRLRTGGADLGLVQLSGCEGGSWNVAKASTDPFAGWTAADGEVRPTQAILRRCPANQPKILALTLGESGKPGDHFDLVMRDETHWEARVPGSSQTLLVRSGADVGGSSPICGGTCPTTVLKSPGQNIDSLTRGIDIAYRDLARKYGRYPESWLPYRVKVTKAIGVLWLAAAAVLALVWSIFRRIDPRLDLLTTAASIVFWICVAAWLQFIYFKLV